jgi:hypothetical protein
MDPVRYCQFAPLLLCPPEPPFRPPSPPLHELALPPLGAVTVVPRYVTDVPELVSEIDGDSYCVSTDHVFHVSAPAVPPVPTVEPVPTAQTFIELTQHGIGMVPVAVKSW